jgi:low temperature requirement protein LtrA
MAERRTSPIELLWDLVFVFAVTQVTTLLSRDLEWRGLGRSMLVLALVWWAWSALSLLGVAAALLAALCTLEATVERRRMRAVR